MSARCVYCRVRLESVRELIAQARDVLRAVSVTVLETGAKDTPDAQAWFGVGVAESLLDDAVRATDAAPFCSERCRDLHARRGAARTRGAA